jgi:hypothetical protein
MKHILVASLLAFLFGVVFVYESKAQTNINNVSFNVFYRALSPYGIWFQYSGYGMCWKPSGVSRSWQPYRNGYWIWTNYGWTWMSNYSWGWAPFHYGRWIIDPYHGWIWVPDYEWAPAWVQWRYSNDYVGWAPLPPGVRFDIHIGYNERDYDVNYNYWSYINCRDFNSRNYTFITGNRIQQIHKQTRNITNISLTGRQIYNYGPSVADIERATRSRITQYSIVDDNRATNRNNQRIENNNVYVYRPAMDRSIGSTRNNRVPNRSEQSRDPIEDGNRQSTINRTPDTRSNEPNRGGTNIDRSNTNNRTNSPQRNESETPTIKTETPSSERRVTETPNTTNRSSQNQETIDNRNTNSNNNERQRNR